MRTGRLILFVVCALLAFVSCSFAADYYVNSATGNDTNDGSQASPWATFAGKTLAAGDTVYCEGTFTAQSSFNGLNGSAEAPITFKSYGEGARLSRDADSSTYGIYISGSSNIIIDGFYFTGWFRAIHIENGSSNIQIQNCTFKDVHTSGGGEGCGIWVWAGSNITVHHNTFINVGTGPSEGCVITGPSHNGVYIYNNVFYDVFFCTRNWGSSGNVQFKNNICYSIKTAVIHNSAEVSTNTRSNNIYYNPSGSVTITDSNGFANGGNEQADVNPLFVDAAGFDFTLQDSSPAIDAGVDLGYSFENNAPDIGRYEKAVVFEGSMSGTVKDSSGNPVEGVKVITVPGNKSAITDAAGNYSLDVANGTYTISATKTGYYYFTESVDVNGPTVKDIVIKTRPATATTFYVNTNTGSDQNDGLTPETAWKSVSGNLVMLIPGDTVMVEGTSDSNLVINSISGTSEAPITFKAYGNGYIINSPNTAGTYGVKIENATTEYIVIDGFEITGGARGVLVSGASNVTIKNCKIHDINIPSVDEGAGIWESSGHNNKYYRNLILNISTDVAMGGAIVTGGSSSGSQIYYNTIVNVSNAVRAWSGSTIAFKNNICYKIRGLFDGNNGVIHSDSTAFVITSENNIFFDYVQGYDNNTGNDMLGVDPKFVDAGNGDYTLKLSSPAIDSGNDMTVTYSGDAPDLGAFESDYDLEYGYVEGFVTREGSVYVPTGTPLAGATVTISDFSALTDASGYYKVRMPIGSYNAQASYGKGLSSDSAENIVVVKDETTAQNFEIPLYAGNTYYVSSTRGDDYNDGSYDYPFSSIDVADVFGMLEAGDTVIVEEGTYADYESLFGYEITNASGDAMAPIVFKAAGNVVIDMTDYMEYSADAFVSGITVGSENNTVSGIILDGFEFTNTQYGIYFGDGSNDNVVYNCRFHDIRRPAETGTSMVSNSAAGVCFSVTGNNVCMNNVFYNIADETATTACGAILMPLTTGLKVYNNTFDNTTTVLTHWGAVSGSNSFVNNIVMNMTGNTALMGFGADYIMASNNLFCNNNANVDANVMLGDNNFVASAGLDADYNIAQSSLAIDAGYDLGYPYEGAAPDLGARESSYTAVAYNTVTGIVVNDVNDTPVVGAKVTIDDNVTLTTVADGAFDVIPYRTASSAISVDAAAQLYAPYSNSFSLTAGANEVEVRLTYAACEVTGTVTDSATHNPIKGAAVEIGAVSATTDKNGAYSLFILPGTYTATVSHPRYSAYTGSVTITPASSCDFTLDAKEFGVYYVNSASGSDANDGKSKANAWATIAGNAASLAAGDTVIVEGTFSDKTSLEGISGEALLPITFIADETNGATINCADDTIGLYISGSKNIVFDGFYFTGCYRGIELNGSGNADVTIQNCSFENIHKTNTSEGAGIWVWTGKNININHNTFVNVGQRTEGCIVAGNGFESVFVYNNVFYNNLYALRVWGTENPVVFKNNIISKISGSAVYSDRTSRSTTVSNNCFYDIAGSNYFTLAGNDLGYTDQGGSITADPLFADALNGDFNVSEVSPVIDAGVDVGFDFIGSAPDMGLYDTEKTIIYEDAASINDAAAFEDGTYVNFTSDVTAIASSSDFADNSFFVSSADRLSGIKCVPSATLAAVTAGDVLKVKGIVKSDANGKYIEVSEITSQAAGTALAALGMTSSVLTNNVLVRVWGNVVSVDGNTMVINNGNGNVTVKLNAATTAAAGDYVTVSGIATATGVQTRNANDVVVF